MSVQVVTIQDNTLDLVGSLAPRQGVTYNRLQFNWPGDITTWTARGHIRRDYADVDTTIDSQFSFTLTYNAGQNITVIQPVLTAAQTALLSGGYVYDIHLIDPNTGIVEELCRGTLIALRRVTT